MLFAPTVARVVANASYAANYDFSLLLRTP
jgi:hypothetical protein